MRRGKSFFLVLLLLVLGQVVIWRGLDLPSPALLIEYGRPTSPATPHRVVTLPIEGGGASPSRRRTPLEFVELRPGYVLCDRHGFACVEGDLLGRLLRPLAVPLGRPARHTRRPCRFRVRLDTAVWIARRPVSLRGGPFSAFGPDPAGAPSRFEFTDSARRTFRPATEPEWDFAIALGAIDAEPGMAEIGMRNTTPPRAVALIVPADAGDPPCIARAVRVVYVPARP